MRKKSPTLVCRLSMSLITKTPEHVVLPYNLPRGRADRGKVAEAVAAAEVAAGAPQAAQAAQAPEGRMVCRELAATRLNRFDSGAGRS
jgi:hypothetical protein